MRFPGDQFNATWYPRIGQHATEELWRFRRAALFNPPVGVVCAAGAGALIGTGSVGDVIGIVLAIAAVLLVVTFIRAQWRTAAAVSAWFGVDRMRWLPRMTPERFDEWSRLRGLSSPEPPGSA